MPSAQNLSPLPPSALRRRCSYSWPGLAGRRGRAQTNKLSGEYHELWIKIKLNKRAPEGGRLH